MRNILIFSLLILLSFSCTKQCWEAAGEDMVESRTLDTFHKIEILDNFIIHFVQDSLSFIELKGKSNLIKNVQTTVENDVLTLSDENTCKLRKGYHQNHLYIHFEDLEYINLEGSSDLYSEDSLYLDHLFINSNADVVTWNLKIKANKFEMQLHAVVGELTVIGYAEQVLLYSSGTNHCFFKDLDCKTAGINHSSTGDFYLSVQERLNISINKSGDFYCYGDPESRSIKIEENETGKVYFFDK